MICEALTNCDPIDISMTSLPKINIVLKMLQRGLVQDPREG